MEDEEFKSIHTELGELRAFRRALEAVLPELATPEAISAAKARLADIARQRNPLGASLSEKMGVSPDQAADQVLDYLAFRMKSKKSAA